MIIIVTRKVFVHYPLIAGFIGAGDFFRFRNKRVVVTPMTTDNVAKPA